MHGRNAPSSQPSTYSSPGNRVEGTYDQKPLLWHHRLCRFTYDLLQFVLQHCGVEIVIDSPEVDPNPDSDLADDILSVFSAFGARMYASGLTRRQSVSESSSSNLAQMLPPSVTNGANNKRRRKDSA